MTTDCINKSERRANTSDYSSVVIVGAGPAGMNAAFLLAQHGVKSTVIDENPGIGGVVYRVPAYGLNSKELPKKIKQENEWIRRTYEQYSEHIHLVLQTRVLGPMKSEGQLALYNTRNRVFPYEFRNLILSTGCYERSVPFPGWTLPGVMTVGGAQLQVKQGRVRPGKKIVLVGSGPLLLVAAKQLHMAGVEVLGVYESGRLTHLAKHSLSLLRNIALLKEGLSHIRYLKQAKIPIKTGWGVIEATGNDELNGVLVAPYDKDWRPVRGEAEFVKTDCLGVGYGFVSRIQLPQLLGVTLHDTEHSGLQPVIDNMMRTSKKNVFVAGDNVGIYGAQVAALQGKLSAISCLMDLERISQGEAEKLAFPIRKKINACKSFQHALKEFSKPRDGLLELPRSDTVICRCENVTLDQIDRSVKQEIQDIVTLKMTTRISMGDCQGKVCSCYCYDYLKKKVGKKDVGFLRARFPLSLISFDAMLAGRKKE